MRARSAKFRSLTGRRDEHGERSAPVETGALPEAPPQWLPEAAAEVWTELRPKVARLLSESDSELFSAYCATTAELRRLGPLSVEGPGEAGAFRAAALDLLRAGRALSITPSTRAAVHGRGAVAEPSAAVEGLLAMVREAKASR